MSATRLFGTIVRHEWRLLISERSYPLLLLLLVALLAYGIFNGTREVARQQHEVAEVQAEWEARIARLLAQLERIDAGFEEADWYYHPGDPARVGGEMGAGIATLPVAPLTALALGHSNLAPRYYRVVANIHPALLRRDTLENPALLRLGRFDVAFVIVYLLPLLILAVSHDLWSREREQGTARLLLAQGVPARTLLLAKLCTRAAPLLALAVVLPILAHGALAQARADLGALTLWMAVVATYGALWFALAAAVQRLRLSSATNAMLGVGAWAVLVLVLPVLLNVLAQYRHPLPSRAEMITAMRDAQVQLEELVAMPNWVAATPGEVMVQPGSVRRFDIQEQINREVVRPALARIEAQVRAQQSLVNHARLASPAILAHEALTALAGTDPQRLADFRAQIDGYHREWSAWFGERIRARKRLFPGDYARMPAHAWTERNPAVVRVRAAWAIAVLAGLSLLLLVLGCRMPRGPGRQVSV